MTFHKMSIGFQNIRLLMGIHACERVTLDTRKCSCMSLVIKDHTLHVGILKNPMAIVILFSCMVRFL